MSRNNATCGYNNTKLCNARVAKREQSVANLVHDLLTLNLT